MKIEDFIPLFWMVHFLCISGLCSPDGTNSIFSLPPKPNAASITVVNIPKQCRSSAGCGTAGIDSIMAYGKSSSSKKFLSPGVMQFKTAENPLLLRILRLIHKKKAIRHRAFESCLKDQLCPSIVLNTGPGTSERMVKTNKDPIKYFHFMYSWDGKRKGRGVISKRKYNHDKNYKPASIFKKREYLIKRRKEIIHASKRRKLPIHHRRLVSKSVFEQGKETFGIGDVRIPLDTPVNNCLNGKKRTTHALRLKRDVDSVNKDMDSAVESGRQKAPHISTGSNKVDNAHAGPSNQQIRSCDHNVTSGMVIGGSWAREFNWPWQVLILSREDTSVDFKYVCGGSLIKNNIVLTAAHCLDGFHISPKSLTIVLGEYDRSFDEGSEQIFQAEQIFKHPNFTGNHAGPFSNDIALIKLNETARNTSRVHPIPSLATKITEMSLTNICYMTGWGVSNLRDNKSDLPMKLVQAKIQIISTSVCNGQQYWNNLIQDSNLCAYAQKTSACSGDSGGPLVCKSQGDFVQVGVTSWGSKTCTDKPSVFTRVSVFRKWIDATIASIKEGKTNSTIA